ncbi:RNA polymerase sigma factor [Actinokineospora sp. PR83]|uniref:RNA polymerase sigma factor n=1 Tax=Actinokineospora sp. PR83 TaxID=2884908 RepID=UPI0027E0C4FD|nr:RNA polymerase sigma factor [Actinokineospora sp. PR83]MCG8920292.1 RNA polymerase sigma factor [Actinokineospora sp. PR83]
MNQSPVPEQHRGGGEAILAAVLGQIPGAPMRHAIWKVKQVPGIGDAAQAAEDICQETALGFYRWWKRTGGVPTEEDARKVMWTILKRKIADFQLDPKQENKRTKVSFEAPARAGDHLGQDADGVDRTRGAGDVLADPAAQAAFDELLDDIVRPQVLAELLDTIPFRQRDALIAVHLEGLDQATAAASLNISVSALQQRLYAGRRALKNNHARRIEKALEEDNR